MVDRNGDCKSEGGRESDSKVKVEVEVMEDGRDRLHN